LLCASPTLTEVRHAKVLVEEFKVRSFVIRGDEAA